MTDRVYLPYAVAIGQLALAWNKLHESLALLFIELLSRGAAYPATDLWNAANFDRPKRLLLKSVLRIAARERREQSGLEADVTWLLDQIDKVEDARNDAIHSPLVFYSEDSDFVGLPPAIKPDVYMGKIVPSLSFDNRRALKLANKDLLVEFRWCRDMSISLERFTGTLWNAVACHEPLPNRPSLPNRGQGDNNRKRRRL